MQIGFIGLGIMGEPMAANLIMAKHEVSLYNIPTVPARLVQAGGISSARALGVSLPNTANTQELFNSCAAYGGKAWDHSALVRALEKLANFEVGQRA